MKKILISTASVLAFALSLQAADLTVKISKVHLCCKKCEVGVEEAVAKVQGLTAAVDKEAGTVTLTGANAATVQKGADALVKAGYFGVSSDPGVKIRNSSGAKGTKVESLKVEGVHLCCPKCVTAADNALKTVSGVKGNTAEKGVKSFEVTGEFNDKDVFAALEKAGLAGTVGK